MQEIIMKNKLLKNMIIIFNFFIYYQGVESTLSTTSTRNSTMSYSDSTAMGFRSNDFDNMINLDDNKSNNEDIICSVNSINHDEKYEFRLNELIFNKEFYNNRCINDQHLCDVLSKLIELSHFSEDDLEKNISNQEFLDIQKK
jgi:hypothetical protein